MAAILSSAVFGKPAISADWPTTGSYRFTDWSGPGLGVFYSIPEVSGPQTPILIVIPGARRNADEYRDQWHDLADANGFIVLTLSARLEDFPTEYDYNAGGVLDTKGQRRPEHSWLFSAIEPLFDDFRERFGSARTSYSIYGHSAGGGFVHRFMLMKPNARVSVAVAANPAFVLLPNEDDPYPFGLRGLSSSEERLRGWLSKPLVILLGERDLNPRTKPLSNGALARRQGPHVFSRGLLLHQTALRTADELGLALNWKLEVVPRVGHSNTHMASHAVRQLFPE